MTPGERLIAKMSEFQSMFAHLRGYDGPFDPQLPRTVFHLLFCPPIHCSIDPFETFGVLQRIFHSKDGKYLVVSFGKTARFWRERPTTGDLKAIEVLRDIRAIAREHRIWVTYVEPGGSWFPRYTSMAGVVLSTPGDPVVVSFDEYIVRLSEFDRSDPPTPGAVMSTNMDMAEASKRFPDSEVVDEIPGECRLCAATLSPVRDYKDAERCTACGVVYVREPKDSELTPEESEMRDVRKAVVNEFLRRIDEEFPISNKMISAEDIANHGREGPDDPFDLFGGQTFGTNDETWRGE